MAELSLRAILEKEEEVVLYVVERTASARLEVPAKARLAWVRSLARILLTTYPQTSLNGAPLDPKGETNNKFDHHSEEVCLYLHYLF